MRSVENENVDNYCEQNSIKGKVGERIIVDQSFDPDLSHSASKVIFDKAAPR